MNSNLVQLDKNLFDRNVLIETHDPSVDIGVSAELHSKKIWEPFETCIFIKLITGKKLFVDIGANIGYYTIIASKYMHEDAQVISVEPEKGNLNLLLKNISHNKINNIIPMNVGCGENDSIAILKRSEHNYGDHQLYLVNESDEISSNKVVKIRSVDSILEDYQLKPDLIKIDTQGFEFSILKGMKKTIAFLNVDSVIIMEFWPYGLSQHGTNISEFLNLIDSEELDIWAIFEEQSRVIVCDLSDIKRWAEGCLHPDSQRYINLLIARKSAYLQHHVGEFRTDLKLESERYYKSTDGDSLAKHLVPSGWSFPEKDGIWSDGFYSEIIFHIDEPIIGKSLILEYYCFHHKNHELNYAVNINKKKKLCFNSNSSDLIVNKIIFDDIFCENEAKIVIGFDFINPVSPLELDISEDSRLLGIFLISYKLI